MDLIVVFVVLLFTLVAVALAIGSRMPNSWQIEKAVLVNTTTAELYPFIADLQRWQTWTVWNPNTEPNLSFQYPNKTSAGQGAKQIWTSPRLKGELLITAAQTNESISYTFSLHKGDFVLIGTIAIGAADTFFTQVAWRCSLRPIPSPNPIQRYLGNRLRASFEADIEESLQNLVAQFEGSHPIEEREEEL